MVVSNTKNVSEIQNAQRLDAEFFDPKYEPLDAKLNSLNLVETLGSLSNFVRKGIFDISPSSYKKMGVPLVRTLQIKTPICNEDNIVYLSQDQHERLYSKTSLFPGDLVFTKIGAGIGDVAILPDKYKQYNFSQNVAGLSINKQRIDPYYLLAFLIGSYGRTQTIRHMMPSGQGKLELNDIKKIRIPRFGRAEEEVASLVQSAEVLLQSSLKNYRSAEQVLESELGLGELKLDTPVSYSANFSDVTINNRVDADFYKVSFVRIHEHLDGLNTARLSTLVSLVKGIEVGTKAYTETGIPFLRVSNITASGVKFGKSDKFVSEKSFRALTLNYQPKVGEILLTKDGSAGISIVIDDPIEGIISGGIVRLVPKDSSIPLDYLSLVINSKACRMQVEQECSGALILHWKPSSIKKLRIPILSPEKMKEIAGLAIQAKTARRESVRLLDQAKARVEQLIEESVAA